MRGHVLTINEKKYTVRAIFAYPEKTINHNDVLGLKLSIEVRDETGKIIDWKDMKGTYLANKISDFAENSFNGQNSFYWSYKKENEGE